MCVNVDNPFLDQAIFSVLEQDDPNFEFVIVANNCSDELYNKLCKYDDERIRLFRTSIGQLSYNLNYGVDQARGQYIIRMDSDDVCFSQRLSICKKYIGHGYDVVAFSAELIDETDRKIGVKDLGSASIKQLIYKNPVVHPATMIRKDALISIRGYLGGLQSEDYDLWIRMFNKSYNFHFSSEIVLKYRIREGQSKGALLPYCEVAGYFLREFLASLKIKFLLGFSIACFKRFIR